MGIEQGKDASYRGKMAERRKSSKPIMEKRRRERINNSLNELKNLLLESRKKDSTSCCSKLEKADILEMTVQYLKSIRSQQEKASTTTDPMALAHYRAGFNHSAMELRRFLIDMPDIEVKVRTRLLAQLSNSCHAVLSNQVSTKQYYPSLYPTSIHQSPETSPPILKDTSLSTSIPRDPAISAVTPHETLPYYFNPSLQLMPSPLTNGTLAAVLVPSPNFYTALSQPQILPSKQFKLEPGSPTSTTIHGHELYGKITETSNNDSVLTSPRRLNTTSRTSPQVPEPDDGNVWRPWS